MRKLLPTLLALAIVALVVTPFVLHFGQQRHDRVTIEFESPAEGRPAPASGEHFAIAMAALIQNELSGFTGWRPNDLPPWGPGLAADNNANRQLGILQALRASVRVFKDDLTKVSSDVFDPNLVAAENNLRNDPTKWAFPSAESRYREAVANLRAYAAGLKTAPPTSRPLNARNTELVKLIESWNDLLGDAHAELFRSNLSWFAIDDIFYHVQGTCHVIAHLIPAVAIEYRREVESRPALGRLLDEARQPLEKCATMKPLIVLNGSDTSVLANHRRNLSAYVNEARQKLYSLRDEVEK